MSAHLQRMMARAAAVLRALGFDRGTIRVAIHLEHEGRQLHRQQNECGCPWPDLAEAAGLAGASGVRKLSLLERKILDVLADGAWKSSAQVHAKLNNAEGIEKLKVVLSNLAEPEVGVLESSPGRGYRLVVPALAGVSFLEG